MRKLVLIIIALWCSIIGIFIVSQEKVFFFGYDVYLKVKPIDPKDFLRGNYVDLKFEINNVPMNKTKKDKNKNVNINQDIYTILNVNENSIANAIDYKYEKPIHQELYIKGKVSRCYPYRKALLGEEKLCDAKYGIENYFTTPTKAKQIEHDLVKGGLAKVRIDKFGKAKVIELKSFN